MSIFDDDLAGWGHNELPNFGIGSITLSDAAMLIAKDIVSVDVDYAVNEIGLPLTRKQIDGGEAKSLIASFFEHELCKATEAGSVNATRTRRTFDNSLAPNATYVTWKSVAKWLEERAYEHGPRIEAWLETERALEWALVQHSWRLRAIAEEGGVEAVEKMSLLGEQDDNAATRDQLLETVKDLRAQLHAHAVWAQDRAKSEALHHEQPLSTRERSTLLKMIIGMAVDGYSYDPSAAKSTVVGEIAAALTDLGLSVSDDTVRTWLRRAAKDLPGRVERRSGPNSG